MECVAPDEISEEQLLAYIDDEANDATIDHIRRCAYCAQRTRAYAADQTLVRAIFYRIQCPDAHTLGEYHQGLLSSEQQSDIEEHLKICSACSAEVADLDRFLKETPLIPPLAAVTHRLKRLVASKASPPSEPATGPPALALRGTAAAPPDIYQAQDIRLVVGLEADGVQAGCKMLLGFTSREGQPLASLTGAQVQLRRGQATVATEQVDSLGNFVFSGLTSGKYELRLTTDQEQVVIERIVV